MYFLSCTVSKLWPIIGQIFASDMGVPHFNALAKGNRPCEYPDNLYLSRKYTVPQKTSAFLFFQYLSEETNCNCCTAAYLFTYFCLLLPVICVALFYCQFFLSPWSVIFKATNANPQPALFRVTNIWRNATLPAVRCKNFAFYKVVW